MSEAATEMPKYRCHKEVWALKIKKVLEPLPSGHGLLVFEDDAYEGMIVDVDWIAKHDPQPGGYYVVYADGYTSFSPAEAFESGYTRI